MSIGLNVLEFLCVPLYTEFLSDLSEKFQVASVYNTNVEFQIWCFCCNLFLSYADNRLPDTHTHTHRPFAKNVIFGFRSPQNVKIHQNVHFENLTQTILSLLIGKRKQKTTLKSFNFFYENFSRYFITNLKLKAENSVQLVPKRAM